MKWCPVMRKYGFFGVVVFGVIQAAILISLKRFHSFADSKAFLAFSEGLLVFTTIAIYLLSKPTQKARRPQTEIPPPKKQEQDVLLKTAQEEKAQLFQTIQRLQESELFAKQRIEDLEKRSSDLSAQLAQTTANLVDTERKTDSCCQTIQIMSLELDHLTSQLEQERRQHSIEIRTLLGKEAENNARHIKSIPAKASLQPLPSVLLLLSTCQKGLDLHTNNDWPSGEHRLLVRRKFFDVAQKMGLSPLAIISFDSPTDHFLSSKLPPSITINEIRTALLPYKESLERLKRFEPYHIVDEQLGGRWIAFRTAWDNLEDLIALAPAKF